MKILYAFLLILIYSVIVQGQIQSVIGNSGGEYRSNGFVVEYTLGETIIPTLSNNKLILTQGFHQPDIFLSTATVQIDDSVFEINVFPNPFRSNTSIELSGDDIPEMRLDVIDIQGRILRSKSLTAISSQISFDGSDLTEGIYFLRFRDDNGRVIHSHKVLKLQ